MSTSRTSSLVVAVTILAAGLVVWFIAWPTAPSSADRPLPSTASKPSSPVLPEPTTKAAPPPAAPAATPEAATTATGTNDPTSAKDADLAAIQELAITYDAVSIPALAAFLEHKDPEVRAAARDGLVTLGERGAIPFLQKTSRTAAPDEARALLEAAEFLALPTLTEHRAAQKAAKAKAP